MNRVGELFNKHKGSTIVIMGGGSTLPSDLKNYKADIYISCNHHAVSRYHADYITAMDSAVNSVPIHHFMAKFNTPLISPYKHYGKYRVDLTSRPHLDHFINTGIMSIFIAQQMGASRIICCGFDFYQSDENYFDCNAWVRESNKTKEYLNKCVNRVKQINAPVEFTNKLIRM